MKLLPTKINLKGYINGFLIAVRLKRQDDKAKPVIESAIKSYNEAYGKDNPIKEITEQYISGELK